MNDLMRVLQEADLASVNVEKARQAFEAAKAALEKAKVFLEENQDNLAQVFTKAEEIGLSKAKLKKLTEERTAALMASGLLPENRAETGTAIPKMPKAAKKKTPPPPIENETDEEMVLDSLSTSDETAAHSLQ